MTGKQIEAAKNALHQKYYGDNCIFADNLKQPWTEADELLDEELSCREMINSILIYGGNCSEDSYQYKTYLTSYVEGNPWHKGIITKERLAQLIEEQKADFAKAEVGFAGCDSEGCSYNYCRWADEQ